MNKIKTKQEIAVICEELRSQGKKIVTTNGSFDILHYGHVFAFNKAKEQGDILIVGLNSDISIKKYKGNDRPIIPQEYRAKLLAALECVDYVVLFDETIPNDFLEKVKPDVHVNEANYGENCIEAPVIKKHGGKLYLFKREIEGVSTTGIIHKILNVYGKKD
ncbi:adenylyltransferase/cytidyltransferase family protein [Candidatus Woesearchaeota archaeon]|nr:adenylyltransferase/cytidyltransferase family protein [Candidatus Woesearchaeota archaeon]